MGNSKSVKDWIKTIESNESSSIILSVAVATLIFAYNWTAPLETIWNLPLSFAAVVTAFMFHELAHRFVSRKLRCHAVYKIWVPGIIFGLLMMLMGVKLVILGAVVISTYSFGRWGMKSKRPSMREVGLIASSGPAINILMAMIFKIIAGWSFAGVFGYLASINIWIGMFNLIPVKPLDGSKIFYWNTTAWMMMVITAVLIMLPSTIFSLFI